MRRDSGGTRGPLRTWATQPRPRLPTLTLTPPGSTGAPPHTAAADRWCSDLPGWVRSLPRAAGLTSPAPSAGGAPAHVRAHVHLVGTCVCACVRREVDTCASMLCEPRTCACTHVRARARAPTRGTRMPSSAVGGPSLSSCSISCSSCATRASVCVPPQSPDSHPASWPPSLPPPGSSSLQGVIHSPRGVGG